MKRQRSRMGTVLLAAVLVLAAILPCAAQAQEQDLPFRDVDSGQWFAPAVQYVYTRDLMKGVSSDVFDPDGVVFRCMAVSVLYRMEQEPETDAGLPFADVETGRYYTEAVRWAVSKGIVNGYGDGRFGPEDSITREQLANILYQYAERSGYDLAGEAAAQKAQDGQGDSAAGRYSSDTQDKKAAADAASDELERFSDRSAVSGWAEDAMQWAVRAQLIMGDGGRLLPQDSLNRKQLAQILQRVDEKIEEQKNASGGSGQNGQGDADDPVLQGNFADDMAALMPADKNWALSPYSLEMCMAMFANGTKGATKEEFLELLRIRDLDEYNASVRDLLNRYDTYSAVMNLETANSIWLNQSEFGGQGRFLDSFSDTLRLHYRADAVEVTSADSVERINAWAAQKTHGLIKRIAEEDNRDFATAVANALYFKAGWALPFDTANTKDQIFHNFDGSESSVPFMHQLETFGYYCEDGVKAVKLNYSNTVTDPETGKRQTVCSDADFSMYILMSTSDGSDINNLDDIHIRELLDRAEFRSTKVDLSLPKFKIEYGGSVDRELQTLGIRTAYSPAGADLTGMVDPALLGGRKLYLDSVVHKVSVNVDEAGTEAAAVTVMFTEKNTSVNPKPPVEFRADRPFLFAIRDNTSGQILFSGAYLKASK